MKGGRESGRGRKRGSKAEEEIWGSELTSYSPAGRPEFGHVSLPMGQPSIGD